MFVEDDGYEYDLFDEYSLKMIAKADSKQSFYDNIFSSFLFLLLLSVFIWWQRRRPQLSYQNIPAVDSHETVTDATTNHTINEELNRTIREARMAKLQNNALNHNTRRNLRHQPSIRKPFKKRFPKKITKNNNNSNNSNNNNNNNNKEIPQKQKQKQPQKQQKQKQQGDGVRKATLAEEITWKQDKQSELHFGFNVYGHESASICHACATTPTTTTTHHQISPLYTVGTGIRYAAHIDHLPADQTAYDLLLRLQDEFEPVVVARGWRVLALTEFCCCGDGEDHHEFIHKTKKEEYSDNNNNNNNHRRAVVLGYCVSTGDQRTALGIHIRLRPPGTCHGAQFYPYEQLAKTMAHELAHIKIAPHNAAFFQLMKQIQDEHLLLRYKKLDAHFPVNSTGRRLGSAVGDQDRDSVSARVDSDTLRRRVATAAAKRKSDGRRK